MFEGFNICYSYPFCTFLLYCPPKPQAPLLALPAVQIQPNGPNFQSITMNLTVEDLQAAGYHHARTPWSEEEDAQLLKLSKKTDLTWSQIAELIPKRSAKMCYSRFRRISNQTKERWTSKEDEIIIDLVGKYGEDWISVSKNLQGRSPKQLEQHYNYCLRPDINKSQWTIEEDLHLIDLLAKFGKNWPLLEQNMNGRTQHQIKNRFFGRLKKLQERKLLAGNDLPLETSRVG